MEIFSQINKNRPQLKRSRPQKVGILNGNGKEVYNENIKSYDLRKINGNDPLNFFLKF
jgi:hypothetical protein